jgi:CheY-like chemotaxis protein
MASILLLEDDPLTCEWLDNTIKSELSDLRPEIEVIETESEFTQNWIPEVSKGIRTPPDVIVIDIMLRWTDPSPDQPPRPPEVIEGGFVRAGLRCLDLIRKQPVLSQTRVILFTSLTPEDLNAFGGKPQEVLLVQKDDQDAVLGRIRAALTQVTN